MLLWLFLCLFAFALEGGSCRFLGLDCFGNRFFFIVEREKGLSSV